MNSSDYPDILENLIRQLKSLPGIGRRGAERMALSMLKWPPETLRSFGALLQSLPEEVTHCPQCGNLTGSGTLCPVCSDLRRDASVVCVVEEFSQIRTMEKSRQYQGMYHVLGGKLSPLDRRSGEDLFLTPLLDRLASGQIKEVILALGTDVEGRATAIYLTGLVEPYGCKITQLAQGLPAGADLSYADAATVAAALAGRVAVKGGFEEKNADRK